MLTIDLKTARRFMLGKDQAFAEVLARGFA
jgi:hypothetical protein